MTDQNYNYRVLVIEDSPGDFMLVQDYLDESILNTELIHAKTFKQAKQILEQTKERIDIILLDLSLPDVSRAELIEKMKHISLKIPTIVLTGYSDFNFATKSLSLGISDYLIKENINSTILYKSILYNTERFKFVKNLQDSEKRYSDLFHLSPIPKLVQDLSTNIFLDVNEAAIHHYGYSLVEFLNMTMDDIVMSTSDEINISHTEKISPTGDMYDQNVERHRKKNGETILVEVKSSVLNFRGRSARLTLANDITDKFMHIKTIEYQNEKLREIAWLQSHVVRAPLARMMGLIHSLSDDLISEKERKAYLSHIMRSAKELDTIIKNVVNKSRQIKFKSEKNEITSGNSRR